MSKLQKPPTPRPPPAGLFIPQTVGRAYESRGDDMTTLKELVEKLECYGFTDKHGHHLENCVDFLNLKASTEAVSSIGSFGWALEHMKCGKRVTRAGWNGKGMWLWLVREDEYRLTSPLSSETLPVAEALEVGTMLPWIMMKTAGYRFVPWLASQTDMLAEDWEIIE